MPSLRQRGIINGKISVRCFYFLCRSSRERTASARVTAASRVKVHTFGQQRRSDDAEEDAETGIGAGGSSAPRPIIAAILVLVLLLAVAGIAVLIVYLVVTSKTAAQFTKYLTIYHKIIFTSS